MQTSTVINIKKTAIIICIISGQTVRIIKFLIIPLEEQFLSQNTHETFDPEAYNLVIL
jgi:hypothetical protein